jgi:hypothetical protein
MGIEQLQGILIVLNKYWILNMHSFEQINNFSCLEYDTLFHSDSDTEHKITGKREPESFVKLLSADTTRAA